MMRGPLLAFATLVGLMPALVASDVEGVRPSEVGRVNGGFRVSECGLCRWAPTGLGEYVPMPPGHRYKDGEILHCYVGAESVPNGRGDDGYRVRLARKW